MSRSPEFEILQRKIFTQWVYSKLQSRNIPLKDCVNDMTGWVLAQLVEILSDTDFPKMKKIHRNPKIRAQELDSAELSLSFVSDQGVEMKLPISSENLISKDVKPILALIWALMRKFIRFSDDDDGPNPQDALLMWVRMQIDGYDNVKKVQKFPSDFYDGTALCAIIHKNRPKLLDIDSIDPSDGNSNLKKAFEGAERYFHLEQFLTPDEFRKLDDKSMFVYISEYFYGVARMRKFELAARRISRLVEYTKINDQMKKQYDEKSQTLRDHLDKVMSVLNNREIDNTMHGARHKLEEFSLYKANDKSEIAGQFLDVESFYNHLAMRLSDHNRPPYQATNELSLAGLNNALKFLEETEHERSVALNKELNRQIKLVQHNDSHISLQKKFESWADIKAAYLEERESISTTNDASFHITTLKAFIDESKAVKLDNNQEMKVISDFLEKEKYENLSAVKERENSIETRFEKLYAASNVKKAILDDHLARELFNEKLRLDDSMHCDNCQKISDFETAKTQYLKKKEIIDSVDEARTQLSTLEACSIEIEDFQKANVPSLKEFGNKIKSSKYETEISSSKYEKSDELNQREKQVDVSFENLELLHKEKLTVLEDDMAREIYKEKIRVLNGNHKQSFSVLNGWIDEKEAYLNVKEIVNSISDARLHLSRLSAFNKEKDDQISNGVGSFTSLGKEITTASYNNLSSWKFETPGEVGERETSIDARFNDLSTLYAKKNEILDDDLAREEFKDKILLLNDRHISMFKMLNCWCDEKDAYLLKKEDVKSIADANLHLSLLSAFLKEKSDRNSHVHNLIKLGEEIKTSSYDNLSHWKFETPEEITKRISEIEERFKKLGNLHLDKKKILDDDLAREEFKARILLLTGRHASSFKTISAFCDKIERYLDTSESIDSIADANLQTSYLEASKAEQENAVKYSVNSLKALGEQIRSSKYEKLSVYVYEHPEAIIDLENKIDARFSILTEKSKNKDEILKSALDLEKRKEANRVLYATLAADLRRWIIATSEAAADTHFGFTLEEVENFGAELDNQDEQLIKKAKEKQTIAQKTLDEGFTIGVKVNVYTKETPETLQLLIKDLENALSKRREEHKKALEVQRINDGLCKDFAELINTFSGSITALRSQIASSSESLEIQLENSQKMHKDRAEAAKIPPIESLEKDIVDRGITNNRHTFLGSKDANVIFEQFETFLVRKAKMLEEEIVQKKLRGMTTKQYQEVKERFAQFDSDKSGELSIGEIKACLFSLGEEVNNRQVEKILHDYGDEQKKIMSIEGFIQFMIFLFGVNDSREEILDGFKMLNRGEELASDERMDLIPNDDLDFIKKTAPIVKDEWNYTEWVNEVFSR